MVYNGDMLRVVNSQLVQNKKVLLRYDIDVALRQAQGKEVYNKYNENETTDIDRVFIVTD